MNTDELSTGGGSPSAKSKKREGEKRTSPLTPLKRKGEWKRTRPGFLRNQLFQDRARAREAKASVRVFFLRGGRGGGGDRRQLLPARREGLCAVGVVLPPLRPEAHRREGMWFRAQRETESGTRPRPFGALIFDNRTTDTRPRAAHAAAAE